jgi:hypothetical protein
MKSTPKDISEILSKKRLSKYRLNTSESFDLILKRYSYNIELCQEFYPLLHLFEVSFRNSLFLSWSEHLEDHEWPLAYEKYQLRQREKNTIELAKNILAKKSRPLEVGRLIAELNFGFWINLFDEPYKEINAHTIKNQFPVATNAERSIEEIRKTLSTIRELRNRIFHHEPIWHWNNLDEILYDTIKIISMINPDLLEKLPLNLEINIREKINERDKINTPVV